MAMELGATCTEHGGVRENWKRVLANAGTLGRYQRVFTTMKSTSWCMWFHPRVKTTETRNARHESGAEELPSSHHQGVNTSR